MKPKRTEGNYCKEIDQAVWDYFMTNIIDSDDDKERENKRKIKK